ncbi:hypothetical protein FBEOM_4874 [Fusarium beomiforme]|uniref:Uncharacterized protein n=1 Tax=Fusarium beomiforme TaxID=44412 RepID=A0A9P5DXT9_9HYPO|nr:hypothetical protein FBEOM_4874 [Fusarium beomiforme]
MRLLYGAFLFLLTAWAAEVRIIWRLERKTNSSSLSVYGTKGTLIAETCGRTLEANRSISFSEVNDEGFGNFTVGNDSFKVQPIMDGGPTCQISQSTGYTLVECLGLHWDPEGVIENKTTGCFSSSSAHDKFLDLQHNTHQILQPRCQRMPKPRLDGDGDPHQRYFHQQLSEVTTCRDDQSCGTASSDGKTFTKGYSMTYNFGQWIAAGFNVGRAWTTGNAYSCNADGKKAQKVCVWYKVAHTAYTVRNRPNKGGINHRHGKQYVIASPNKGNKGGGYECRINEECEEKGARYWDCNGKREEKFTHCPPWDHPQVLDETPGFLRQSENYAKMEEARRRLPRPAWPIPFPNEREKGRYDDTFKPIMWHAKD